MSTGLILKPDRPMPIHPTPVANKATAMDRLSHVLYPIIINSVPQATKAEIQLTCHNIIIKS